MIGQRTLRTEDRPLLTGDARFVDDLALEDALHAVFVRSPIAHARLTGVDASRASEATIVVTARDVQPNQVPGGRLAGPLQRPLLADGVVRFAGEPVAMILAPTRALAVDAAEVVDAGYEPRAPVVDPFDALGGDAPTVHASHGTNLVMEQAAPGDPDLFADADVVVRARFVNQRVAPVPIEPNAAAAAPDGDGLVVWASTQVPHGMRDAVCAVTGLPPESVRVVAPAVGGGFGAKKVYGEQLLVALLAHRLRRPVRWVETRSENLLVMQHGRGQRQEVTVGAKRDGTLVALRAEVVVDAGAYPGGAFIPMLTGRLVSGVYRIPRIEFGFRGVMTTTTPTGAYRGAGRPEAAALVERAVDMVAAELGMDPIDLRRRNLIPRDAMPYTSATGAVYDSGDYAAALDEALRLAGYDELRAEQSRRRGAGEVRQLGVGISVFVETSGGGSEFGSVEVRADGSVLVLAGTSAHGQGHATAFAQIAADVLDVPFEAVTVVESDTAAVPRGRGTMGSRSTQMGGSAVLRAAEDVVERARLRAGELLEAAADDVVRFDGGRFGVAGTPSRSLGWADLAPLHAAVDFAQDGPTFPYGAHVAVVEVDTEIGDVRLVRYVAVDDCGRVVNPALAEGQVHGGVAQGAAQALWEQVAYDADGNPLTSTLATYAAPSPAELPSIETAHLETPSPRNPLGAKGVGESGTIGSTPAVQNAVVDALAHLGVRHIDMPLTPERVWRAVAEASFTP